MSWLCLSNSCFVLNLSQFCFCYLSYGNLYLGKNYCHQLTVLISVAFLQSKCVLGFRLVHEEQYQQFVKVLNIKNFSDFLNKEV